MASSRCLDSLQKSGCFTTKNHICTATAARSIAISTSRSASSRPAPRPSRMTFFTPRLGSLSSSAREIGWWRFQIHWLILGRSGFADNAKAL